MIVSPAPGRSRGPQQGAATLRQERSAADLPGPSAARAGAGYKDQILPPLPIDGIALAAASNQLAASTGCNGSALADCSKCATYYLSCHVPASIPFPSNV